MIQYVLSQLLRTWCRKLLDCCQFFQTRYEMSVFLYLIRKLEVCNSKDVCMYMCVYKKAIYNHWTSLFYQSIRGSKVRISKFTTEPQTRTDSAMLAACRTYRCELINYWRWHIKRVAMATACAHPHNSLMERRHQRCTRCIVLDTPHNRALSRDLYNGSDEDTRSPSNFLIWPAH